MDYAAIEAQPGLAGNVYFLAPVNFENAAFCKIGRAKNDPEARCAQINKSSTGDVLWGVRQVVTVDDHVRFECLVHQLLASWRNQGAGQRREIFHLPADEAFGRACEMLAQLTDIKEIPVVVPAPVVKVRRATASGGAKGHVVKKGDEVYLPLFMSWARRLEIKGGGKPFGQWKSPVFGYSDDVKGVQWNIGVNRETREIRLGVNLEGSAKNGGSHDRVDQGEGRRRPDSADARARRVAGRLALRHRGAPDRRATLSPFRDRRRPLASDADRGQGLSRPEPAVPRSGGADRHLGRYR
jgi:T5orf172 domain